MDRDGCSTCSPTLCFRLKHLFEPLRDHGSPSSGIRRAAVRSRVGACPRGLVWRRFHAFARPTGGAGGGCRASAPVSGNPAADRRIATTAPSTSLKEGVAPEMTGGELCPDEARTAENGPTEAQWPDEGRPELRPHRRTLTRRGYDYIAAQSLHALRLDNVFK